MAGTRRYVGSKSSKGSASRVDLEWNGDQFGGRLLNYSGFSTAMIAVLSMWTKEGLFTAAMAKKTVGIIRTAINEGKEPGGQTWEDLDPIYEEWKSEHFGTRTPWNLTGSVRTNLLTRKTGNGWTAGLDKRIRVPKMQYGRKGGRAGRGDNISLEDYALMMEHGTSRMQARPLFLPAMTVMVQEHYPQFADAVKQDIDTAMRSFRIKREANPKWQKPGQVVSQATASMSKGQDPVAGISSNESLVKEILVGRATKKGGYEVVSVSGMDNTANRKQAREDKKLVSRLFKGDKRATPEERTEAEEWLKNHYGEY